MVRPLQCNLRFGLQAWARYDFDFFKPLLDKIGIGLISSVRRSGSEDNAALSRARSFIIGQAMGQREKLYSVRQLS